MMDYKAIYYKNPSDNDLVGIKNEFNSGNHIASWEDYYWAAKCLCEYDDDFNAKLVNSMLNNAIRYGLTYRLNKDYYLDAMKVLATLNTQLGNYEVVLNYLQTLLEYDENSPDWVYHDFATAQIHTDNLRRILRNPKMFLSDLSKNDDNSEKVKHRQRNIFKDLLVEGIGYLKENPNSEVNLELLSVAANKYNVDKSAGWNQFLALVKGESLPMDEPSGRVSANSDERKAYETHKSEKIGEDSRPLIVSLFPEDERKEQEPTVDLEKVYLEKQAELEKKEQNIEKQRLELEKKDSVIDKKTQEIDKKDNELKNKARELEERENEIKKRTQELERNRIEYENKNEELKVVSYRQEELNKEKQRLQLEVQSNNVEKAELKKRIEEFEDEKRSLELEIRTLRQEREEEKKRTTNDIEADILIHLQTFLLYARRDLRKWLNLNLPCCSNDWWNDCVLNKFKYDQIQYIHDNRYSGLEKLDLSMLIKVLKRNWGSLKKSGGIFLSDNEYKCVEDMIEVRNRWSHTNDSSFNSDTIIEDLATIKFFMTIIGSSSATREKVADYLKFISKTKMN